MRNKLKHVKKCKVASCQSSEEETLVLSCSDNETAPGRDASSRRFTHHQEQRSSFYAKNVTIAPIFRRTQQPCRRKVGRDEELCQQEEKLLRSGSPPPLHLPPAPLRDDVQLVESQHGSRTVSQLEDRRRRRRRRRRSWTGQMSACALHSCLEEIQTSNRAFPVRVVFSTLQKKASERLQDPGPTAEDSLNLNTNLKKKRKHENESSEQVSKRLRSGGLVVEGATGAGSCHVSAQSVVRMIQSARSNKLSRSHRLRQQNAPGLLNHSEPHSGSSSPTDSHRDSPTSSDTLQRDYSFEELLWTDKYSPQHSGEVIGNSTSVRKLHSWLNKWKLRADCEERRKMEERKREENSNDSWDCGDFQGEAGQEDHRGEPLCNTMLITGPPGVGKTASVYACSLELGFKVFEVNCSSQRSGRHVLSQLKEATQSHLVEISGKDPLKPAYLNNYSCNSKSEPAPGKTVPPKKVTSKKKTTQISVKSSHKGKAHPATVTLAKYFRMKAKADLIHVTNPSAAEKLEANPSPGSDPTAPQNKKTATSLILFEEVDVIFDDDVGFLAAIKAFMETTKRPVILTTNDKSFRERFSCSLEEVLFKPPSVVKVCSYLQLVCLAENVWLELEDVSSLLTLCRGDVRRCLLQLQLWVNSGGGRAGQSRGFLKETTHSRGDNVDPRPSQCDQVCTASMLGLQTVTQNQLQNILTSPILPETEMNRLLWLLAESWRGGVPLLYSNLDLLLPTGAKGTSLYFPDKGFYCGLQDQLASSDTNPHILQLSGTVSPKELAPSDRKSIRSISRLSRRKYITATSSSVTQTPQRTSVPSGGTPPEVSIPRAKTNQNTAKVETCLEALADFFDLMSYLDATVTTAGSHTSEMFIWTGAEITDGLLCEVSEEEEEGVGKIQEKLLDIQAAVEGLGCHRCCWRISEAWAEAKHRLEPGETRHGRLVDRQMFPLSSKRKRLSFIFQPLCAPGVSQRRYELSRAVLSSKSFSLLGNRQAVSVDYMPVLRYICRLHRAQRQKEEPVRCVNYLSCIHMGLSKWTIQLLAEDFS